MAINRLEILKPASSDFGQAPTYGHLLYGATDAAYLVSVIATNTTGSNAGFSIYVIPGGSSVTTSIEDYGLITYNLSISGYNTYETFRFALNQNDEVWVAGTEGISYFIQGIQQ